MGKVQELYLEYYVSKCERNILKMAQEKYQQAKKCIVPDYQYFSWICSIS